jgi:hypothetical protein
MDAEARMANGQQRMSCGADFERIFDCKEPPMKLDVQRIDERIARLQELRRIATDPEMTAILTEFIVSEDVKPAPAPRPTVAADAAAEPSREQSAEQPVPPLKPAEEGDVVQNGRSLWGINRR